MRVLILLFIVFSSIKGFSNEPEKMLITVGFKGDLVNLVEKKKDLSYSYELTGDDPVKIENHFGDVKVKIWDKDLVKVNIVVTANAPSEEKVDAFLKIVDIQTEKKSDQVIFLTKLNCMSSSFKNNISKSDDAGDLNFLRVDYMVFMPKGHDLTVNNSHGDVYIPEFHSVLTLKQEYGTLFADHLRNDESTIDVNFGRAFIKSMTGGSLRSTQTSLLIDKIENVQMTNTFGKMKVLEALNSELNSSYTKSYVAKVNESCKFIINYSKEFTLGEILADVKQLEIESSYSNLELPLCIKGKYDFRVESKNTNMVILDEPRVKYMQTNDSNQQHYLIGDESTERHVTKVLLSTSYGRVKVK